MGNCDEDIRDLLRRTDGAARARISGAGHRQRADRALLRDTGDVRGRDVRRPARTLHHHALLRAGRIAAERPLRSREPGRGHHDHFPGPQRRLRGRGNQPELLCRSAGGRREDLRIRRRVCCTPSR